MKTTDARILEIQFSTEDFLYRSPIKFGGISLDRATILNVNLVLETNGGKRATGFGSMPLGNVWSFPSRVLGYDQTMAAMKLATAKVADLYRNCKEAGHPIEITHQLEHEFPAIAKTVTEELQLAEPMPLLGVLVSASSFDAALHDAYGKAFGLNCYSTYHPDFLDTDLGRFLGAEYAGYNLEDYVTKVAKPKMPLYHLVGALDPLTPAEITNPIGDCLPEHLAQWINRDGLTHLKIKLNGDELSWDVERVLAIDAVATEVQDARKITEWFYSLDFNERCRDVQYLLEVLNQVRARAPHAFERIQYVEQPTKRDLKADRANVMHEASKLKPIVIDESLLDLETLLLAKEMGYTGAALKACKGQSQSLLMAAAARIDGMFLCVQDLTCPGASLIQSASLASHIPGIAAIEANSRQYCPAANEPWKLSFPGVFEPVDGMMNTALLDGPGLGAVAMVAHAGN
jgi:L-alanine-DL-glutamate epimerase-like enolase superfamily enzyme